MSQYFPKPDEPFGGDINLSDYATKADIKNISHVDTSSFCIKNKFRLMYSYLKGRKQRVKIGHVYNSWEEILFGVPQGSILGPLLFNIFVCDLFDFIDDDINVASYADDNTPYFTANTPEIIIKKLEKALSNMFSWFSNNGMKAKPDKYHLLFSGKNNFKAKIDNYVIESSKQ